MRLSDLAKRIGARCHGDSDLDVISLGTLEEAGPDQITFLGVSTSREMLASCKAGAVILREEDLDGWQGSALVSKNPNSAYALTARALDTTPMPPPGIHQSAVIADSVKVGVDVSIGPNCVIEENAELGDRVIIEPGSVIGANVVIGSETRLFANVTIMHGVKIGQQCFIKSGAVLGSHGFGNTNEDGQWVRIPQLGGLTVGNRVQIGAVTTIDRGAIGDTVIADGVVIDNLVQIGHNVVLGKGCIIVAQVGISGSTKLGDFVVVGGQVGIAGHVSIGTGAQIAAKSGIIRNIEAGAVVGGYPAQPLRDWHRQSVMLARMVKDRKSGK